MDASRNLTLALRQLKRRGYRRIGWMIPQAGLERNNYHPLAALWAYQQRIAASNRISPFIYDVWQDARAAVWLRKNRPDAIIASGFQWVLRWLGQCGRRVPQEIGFVNFGRSEGEPSAGIDPNPRLVGAAVVDLVVGQLHRNEIGLPDYPKVVLVPGRWVAGPTLQKS
jgi:LacI family transcriptional regulator